MGLGPVILSVRWIRVVLADGSIVKASRTENSEILFGAIGGYNGIGIIVEAELDLADNFPVKRVHRKILRTEYPEFFRQNVRSRCEPVFHNGDIYPPVYTLAFREAWEQTAEKPTVKTRLMPLREILSHPALFSVGIHRELRSADGDTEFVYRAADLFPSPRALAKLRGRLRCG